MATAGIVKSPFSSYEVPEVPLHIAMFAKFAEHGDKVAIVEALSGEEITYTQLLSRARKVGSGLSKLGVKKGDIVALFSYNTPEWVYMFFGTLYAGATVTTINPTYTKYELAHHLQDSGASYLYSIKDLIPICKNAMLDYKNIKVFIAAGSSDPAVIPFSLLVHDDGSRCDALDSLTYNVKEDVALVPYSSGTTGLPKGVMLTHFNVIANCTQFGHPEFIKQEEVAKLKESGIQIRFLLVIPLYHVYGMVVSQFAVLGGGDRLVILPRFEPELFLQSIEKYKVNYLPLVPPIVIFLAKSPLVKKYDLSSVIRAGSGAAPLSKEVEQEFRQRLNVPEMKQGYGMTETTCVACAHSPNKPFKPGSCGMLLPNSEAKVVDPSSGKVLGANERGELWIRGPQIMKGYLNKPEATRNTKDQDGFLHTGDIAYYDEDGFFFIVDRLKELIKVKGFQVAPAELEALLLEHPKIADCGVVGVPDERAGELPRAYIVKKDDITLNESEINSYVDERVAAFKQLKGGIQFISVIPRLPSGKIVRRKLKELATKSKM